MNLIAADETTVTLEFVGITRETEKALLINLGQFDLTVSGEIWVPKSAVQISGNQVTMARRMLESKLSVSRAERRRIYDLAEATVGHAIL